MHRVPAQSVNRMACEHMVRRLQLLYKREDIRVLCNTPPRISCTHTIHWNCSATHRKLQCTLRTQVIPRQLCTARYACSYIITHREATSPHNMPPGRIC